MCECNEKIKKYEDDRTQIVHGKLSARQCDDVAIDALEDIPVCDRLHVGKEANEAMAKAKAAATKAERDAEFDRIAGR